MENLIKRFGEFYRTYHSLIYLSIVSFVAELAYAVMNQSAIPPYLEQIGLKASVGIIIGTFLIVEAVFKSPMGSLGDRVGRRPLIVGGALISCITALGMTIAHNIPFLMLLRTFDGIAAAAIWPTIIAAVGGCVAPEKRTVAMNAVTVTYIIGVALGPLFGGLANDLTGSKLTSFYLVGFLFIVTAVVAYFLTPHRSKEEDESAHEADRGFRASDILTGLKAVPDMMLIAFIAFFGIGLLIPVIKYFAMDELKLSETGYGIMILPIAGAVAIASLAAGFVGDKWGKARSVRLGITVSAISMWVVIFAKSPIELAVSGMFLGIGFVLAMPAWLALISDMAAPRVRGTVIGALGTAQGVGAWLGTNIGSYLYIHIPINIGGLHLNSHYTPFVITAVSLSVCLVLALIFIKDHDTRRIGMSADGGLSITN
ncbi:MAG: MFS transporter [Armatimonadota bacterium]